MNSGEIKRVRIAIFAWIYRYLNMYVLCWDAVSMGWEWRKPGLVPGEWPSRAATETKGSYRAGFPRWA